MNVALIEMRREIGTRLRHCRERAGMSRRQLAEQTQVGHINAIGRWENGEVMPGLDRLALIAETLGLDLHWLATGDSWEPAKRTEQVE